MTQKRKTRIGHNQFAKLSVVVASAAVLFNGCCSTSCCCRLRCAAVPSNRPCHVSDQHSMHQYHVPGPTQPAVTTVAEDTTGASVESVIEEAFNNAHQLEATPEPQSDFVEITQTEAGEGNEADDTDAAEVAPEPVVEEAIVEETVVEVEDDTAAAVAETDSESRFPVISRESGENQLGDSEVSKAEAKSRMAVSANKTLEAEQAEAERRRVAENTESAPPVELLTHYQFFVITEPEKTEVQPAVGRPFQFLSIPQATAMTEHARLLMPMIEPPVGVFREELGSFQLDRVPRITAIPVDREHQRLEGIALLDWEKQRLREQGEASEGVEQFAQTKRASADSQVATNKDDAGTLRGDPSESGSNDASPERSARPPASDILR